MLKKSLSLAALLTCAATVFAQALWTDVQERNFAPAGTRHIIPQKYRTVALDLATLRPILQAAPERFTPEAAASWVVLEIPMPDGRMADFRLFESSVMEKPLQDKYPNIRSYTGVGISDPTATMKCDFTPKGFHAMILATDQSPVFIDPYSEGDVERYISYYKKDYLRPDKVFMCETESLPVEIEPATNIVSGADAQGDCQLRRYRLALACTGEYANFHGATGANKAPAIAAMNTSVNRIAGVYERELAVTMVLVANNDLLVYTNASSDPYSNNNGGTMLNQNNTNCNTVIGAANYDIGHVFSTGGGGIAGLGVVCTSTKGRGVTGSNQPIGDPFDIDYVAHEMGHQFAGNHSFNSNAGACNGNQANVASMEPGSGTTIMSYAGICGAHDVAAHSDDYFHAINLQEIGNFVTTGSGNTCPVKTNTGNRPPTVEAGMDRTIPKSTPFALTAVGSDLDSDPITFCWEQMDNQTATMPPVATNTGGPLFRSYKPVASPTRYFPRLQDVISNANPTWEKLPSVARTMKFRVTIRDNHAGAGCTEEDDLTLTVSATAGPFQVTDPNTLVTWFVGENKTVTWAVASTNVAPVNCANVKISLSTDGGLTYPVVLADNVPNNGSAQVVVPNNVSNTCRVKVEAIGNYFYDISNQNFRIQVPPTPTFLLGTSSSAVSACAGGNANFDVNLTSILNFNSPVQLSVSGLPMGATANFSQNPADPSVNTTVGVTLSNFVPAATGVYTLTVTGVSGSTTQSASVSLDLKPGAPTALAAPQNPADGAAGLPLNANLTWGDVQYAESYFVEVATSPDFSAGSIFYSGTSTAASAALANMAPSTVYYWRARAANTCGQGGLSPVYAFQTGKEVCNQAFASTNVPVTIDAATVNTAISLLTVPANKNVTDVNVSANVAHTYVGDLAAWLQAPSGDTVLLFDRPGFPALQFGCAEDNINATLDDEATQAASVLEGLCGTTNPSIGGNFKSLSKLAKFDGQSAQGDWKLFIGDFYDEDGGQITSWSLNFCFADPVVQGAILANSVLSLPQGGTKAIPTANLQASASGTASQLTYVILSLPQNGALSLNGNPLAIGSTFTQANIDGNQVSYTHNGGASTSDQFNFDVVDGNNSAWFHNGVFQISIVQNNLAATAAVTGQILCFGQTTGQVTANVSGGTMPFSFSLNGGADQASNVFGNLGGGSYTVVITDANGFTVTTNAVNIVVPTQLTVSADNDLTDNVIIAQASGGASFYEYSLDGGQNYQASGTFTDLPNGAYTVVVRDGNGCTATASALVAVNSLVASVTIVSPVQCNDGADGIIEITVAGGQEPYLYSLNGGPYDFSDRFENLPPGDYTITVQDNFGLNIVTDPVTLGNPTTISASASADLNTVTVTASGGTGTLSYSLDGSTFQSTDVFSDLANGDYTITVQDANGCTATTTVSVNVPALAASALIEVQIPCFGGGATISISASGGIPPYRYRLDNNPFQTGSTFTNVAAGTHTLRVRDAAGTVFVIQDFVISEPTPVEATATVFSNDLTANASGGTPPYTFALSNGQAPPFDNLINGNYTVTATDANGCTATVSATLNYTPLSATAQIGNPTCTGLTDGRILASAAGGVSPYQYSIDGINFGAAALFTGLAEGTYDITIRDAAGDLFVLSGLVLTEPDPITATAAQNGGTASVTVTASGGTGAFTYQLDNGAFQTSNIFQNVGPGTHTITVKDANGCTTQTSVEVTFPPLVLTVSNVKTTCPDEATGAGDVCFSGGLPPYSYGVGPVVGQSILVNNCIKFSAMPAGVYTVIVTDTNGSSASTTLTITASPAIALTVSNTQDDIVAAATGGTAPLQYQLNNGAFQLSNTFANQPNGTYTITVRDANGCTEQQDFVLNYVGTVEPGEAWGLSVSPNPSSGLFQILVKNAPASDLQCAVFDVAGRQLRQFALSKSGLETLDLTAFPGGLYFLQIRDGQHVGAFRLVKN